MASGYCHRDVLPIPAMVAMECMNVGLNTLFKAATMKGMSYHVFIVYAHVIAALVLLPAPFLSHRSRNLPPLNFSILSKIGLLGLIGTSTQTLGFTGISLSSPTLASAISNVTPAFTFILAVLLRMEKLSLKGRISQAKIIGTVVSITGAFVVTLYKGPPIIFAPKPSVLLNHSLHSSNLNWVLGGVFLTAEYSLAPLWYIVQAQIMREYPAELTVVFFYNLSVSCMASIIGLFTDPDINAWRIRGIGLASVICSGLLGSCLSSCVYAWAIRLKGPFFVAMFKPLSIVIAVAMGIILLGDTLYIGSLIGAMIISVGFYTVMWGKFKEAMVVDSNDELLESPSSHKAPLLQNYKAEGVQSESLRVHRHINR